MSDEVGAEVSAWDGYITGRNLELIPGERIVQSWRTTQFTNEHEDSIITVTLEEVEGGTLLTLVHSNVPDGQTSYEQGAGGALFRADEGVFCQAEASRRRREVEGGSAQDQASARRRARNRSV